MGSHLQGPRYPLSHEIASHHILEDGYIVFKFVYCDEICIEKCVKFTLHENSKSPATEYLHTKRIKAHFVLSLRNKICVLNCICGEKTGYLNKLVSIMDS